MTTPTKQSLLAAKDLPELKVCPFCGGVPTFGLTKRTGCQLHGDPIQYVIIGCRNDKCKFKPSVTGGDRYAHGETGAFFEKGEREAKELAIKYWNDRPPVFVDGDWSIVVGDWKDDFVAIHGLNGLIACGLNAVEARKLVNAHNTRTQQPTQAQKVEGLDEIDIDRLKRALDFVEKFGQWFNPHDRKLVRQAARLYASGQVAKTGWQPIDDHSKTIATGLWLEFPDGHIEWGKWGWSANAEIEAFGTFPIDEFGNRYPCFLPFSTQPTAYFIERRKSPSTPPTAQKEE